MTFNNLAFKYACYCKNNIDNESPTILDIGAQTPTFKIEKFKKYISNISKFNLEQQDAIQKISSGEKFLANDVYIALGYQDYEVIDINGAYNSHKYDLNQDIEANHNFKNQYDVHQVFDDFFCIFVMHINTQ